MLSAVEWKRVWLFFLTVRRTHVTFYGTVNFRKRFIMTVLPIVGWGMWRSLLSMSKGRRTGYNVAHTLTYQMCTYLTGSSEKWIYLAACVMANPPFDTIFYQKWHPTKINAIQNSLNSLVDAASKHSILFSWNFNWAIMEQRRYSLSGEKELATASVVPLLSEAIPRTHLNYYIYWLLTQSVGITAQAMPTVCKPKFKTDIILLTGFFELWYGAVWPAHK